MPRVNDTEGDSFKIEMVYPESNKFVKYLPETNSLEFSEFTKSLSEDLKFEPILKDDNTEVGSKSRQYQFTIKCSYCFIKTAERKEPITKTAEVNQDYEEALRDRIDGPADT